MTALSAHEMTAVAADDEGFDNETLHEDALDILVKRSLMRDLLDNLDNSCWNFASRQSSSSAVITSHIRNQNLTQCKRSVASSTNSLQVQADNPPSKHDITDSGIAGQDNCSTSLSIGCIGAWASGTEHNAHSALEDIESMQLNSAFSEIVGMSINRPGLENQPAEDSNQSHAANEDHEDGA